MIVDLDSYIFKIIEYDPTESPRGVITADEWNTIMNLLKDASNYSSASLQEIISDLYTAHELSSTELGHDGSRLIGVDVIPGITGTNVNAVLRDLKEQLDGVVLGAIPDGSITSEKLAPNLNFEGDTLTFNTYNILTDQYIVTTLDGESTDDQIASAKAVYNLINTKQDKIPRGTTPPNASTPGDTYLQYIP